MNIETSRPQNGRTSAAISPEPWQAQAVELDERLSAETRGLRELLDRERELAVPIQRALDACRARERRIEKAIAALEGVAKPTGRPPAKAKAETKADTRNRWLPSEASLDRIHRALVELGEARTSQVAKRAGMAPETARRALNHLRETERVRIVRQDRRYGATFAPMPGAADAA